jgi:hypothetical protein
VNAIRVRIDNLRVWLFSKEAVNPDFEIVEMFLCTRDPEFGTVEMIDGIVRHGEQIRNPKKVGGTFLASGPFGQ